MNEVIIWACSICAGAAVCLVCEMLLPSDKISKIVRFAVGTFMIGIIILPLGGIVNSVASELDNVKIEENQDSELSRNSEDKATELAKENISSIVEEHLEKIGVKPQKIEIITDSDKLSDITGIESVIYITNEDRGQILNIKNTMKNDLGLECTVMVSGEVKDE